MPFGQESYEICCEWGLAGVEKLRASCDALIIVDVLSFCTCVDIALGRGATIYPYRWRDERAAAFAQSVGALLASAARSAAEGFSLSPASLLQLPKGTRLVLPSPNGATLCTATGTTPTFAGCLRNAVAVSQAASRYGKRIGVIAAGELWPGASLRPAIEDLIGAGTIIANLEGERSPEAEIAVAAWERAKPELGAFLRNCISGRELIERGFADDVELAAAWNASEQAPMLEDLRLTICD